MVNWLTMLVSITQIPVSIGQSDNFKISSGTIQKLSSMMTTTMTEKRHRSTKTRQRNGTTSPMTTMEAPTRRATIPRRRRAPTTTTASTSPSRHLPTRRMKRQKRAGKSWVELARQWRAVVGGERLRRQRRGLRQRGTTGSTRGRARRSARRT